METNIKNPIKEPIEENKKPTTIINIRCKHCGNRTAELKEGIMRNGRWGRVWICMSCHKPVR